MAPKKNPGKRPLQSVPEEPRERRSKRREDRTEAATASTAVPTPQASPPQPARQRMSLGLRTITTGRRILFHFLKEIGLVIGDMIENQGWIRYCSLNAVTYTDLVRTFYENMIIGVNHVESVVKGKRIIISEETLAEILEMPYEGVRFLVLKDRTSALKVVLEQDDVANIGILNTNSLSLEMRLLHSFISRIFLPRAGRFDWVSERDLCLMELIITGEQVNLPALMISQMKESVRKAKASLPFGMVLTLFFEAHHVDLEGEDCKALLHTDTYTAKSLQRMGYVLQDGTWRKKGDTSTAEGEGGEVTGTENVPLTEETPTIFPETSPTPPEHGTSEQIPEFSFPEPDFGFSDVPFTESDAPIPDTIHVPPSAPQLQTDFQNVLSEQLSSLATSLTTSMTDLFCDLKTSVDQRLNSFESKITDLQEKVERLEASNSSSPADLKSLMDLVSSLPQSEIKLDAVQDLISTGLNSLKASTEQLLEECKFEIENLRNQNATKEIHNFDSLHSEIVKLTCRIEELQKEIASIWGALNLTNTCMKEFSSQFNSVWKELESLTTAFRSLEVSVSDRVPILNLSPLNSMPFRGTTPTPTPVPDPTSFSHPRAPPPHASSSRPPRPASWYGTTHVPKQEHSESE